MRYSTLYINFRKQLFEVTSLEELRDVMALIERVHNDFKDFEYVALMKLFDFKTVDITGRW